MLGPNPSWKFRLRSPPLRSSNAFPPAAGDARPISCHALTPQARDKPTDKETPGIRDLAAEEKALRAQLRHGGIMSPEEQQQLAPHRDRTRPVLGPARQRRALRRKPEDQRESKVVPPTKSRGTPAIRLDSRRHYERSDRDFDVAVAGGHNGLSRRQPGPPGFE